MTRGKKRVRTPTTLAYPVRVSVSSSGRLQNKTWGFVPLHSKPHAEARNSRKWVNTINRRLASLKGVLAGNEIWATLPWKPKQVYGSPERHELEKWIELLEHSRVSQIILAKHAHRHLASGSDFFMKRVSAREQGVRDRLRRAGIPVEESIQDLGPDPKLAGARLALFARGNYQDLYGVKGRWSDDRRVLSQLIGILSRMHAAGVSHGHLHLGNWVVDPKGRVKLIDLSRARVYSAPPRSKREFLSRFGKDIWDASIAWALLKAPENYEDNMRPFVEQGLALVLSAHAKRMNTFGVTLQDFDFRGYGRS